MPDALCRERGRQLSSQLLQRVGRLYHLRDRCIGQQALSSIHSPCISEIVKFQGGDKIPRKGGPGISQSDLLVINKVCVVNLVPLNEFYSSSNSSRLILHLT